jgi:hypothetical protein
MAEAAYVSGPVLYDPLTRRFDGALLRLAMIRRNLKTEDLARTTRLSKSTVMKARAGGAVDDSTAMAILGALHRIAPMEVV